MLPHTITSDHTAKLMCALALALVFAAAVSLVRAHLLPTGVDPVKDPVSDIGAGEYRIWYQVAVACLGTVALLLAIVVYRVLRPAPANVYAWLLVFAIARYSIAGFPTDREGEPSTFVGRVHMLLAVAAFVSIAVAAANFSSAVHYDAAWYGRLGLVRFTGLLVVVASVLTGAAYLLAPARRYFGLVERAFYAAMFLWLAVVAIDFLGVL